MKTKIKLDEVDHREVFIELPKLSRADSLTLAFRLQRKMGGRTEELEVKGLYKVVDTKITTNPLCQVIHCVSQGVAPVWKAVKNPPKVKFKIPKTRFVVTD